MNSLGALAPPVRRVRVERHVVLLALVPFALAALGWLVWRVGPWTPPHFDEYRMLGGGDMPAALALGPDGAVWFTIDNADALGVLRNGRVQRIPKGRENLEPLGLAVADDGSVWFTDPIGEAIAHLTPEGAVESFPLPTKLTQFGRLAVATDGGVWAADSWSNSLVRLQAGTFTPYPASTSGAAPFGMAADPHGGVWSTLQSAHKLIHVDAAGQLTELEPPTRSSGPSDIAVDRSGVVWFVELRAGQIGRYANGTFTEFRLPRPQAGVTDLAVAPDGSVWFAELRAQRLGHLRVDGIIDEIALPRSDARPFGVRVDRAGNVWYTDLTGWLGMLPASEIRGGSLDPRRLVPWPRV
jgi:virginiamycin B lyase